MTDPDWEPIMKRAAAIATNRGGHPRRGAIIARELSASRPLSAPQCHRPGRSAARHRLLRWGDVGSVYDGILDFAVERTVCRRSLLTPSP